MTEPKIYAHRGCSGQLPENTMKAFVAAVPQRASGIETDVRFTKDRKLLLLHDTSLKRMFGADINARDYTLSELKKYCISPKYGPQHFDTPVCELCELLQFISQCGLELNIEIKSEYADESGDLERAVADEVERFNVNDRVFYSSFDHLALYRIKKHSPKSRTAILYSIPLYEVEKYADNLGCFAIHPNIPAALYDNTIEKAHEKGLKVNVWTVDDIKSAKELIKAGADGLITNFPKEIREYAL